MELATVQMGKWRKARDEGYALVDSTVKSGDIELAPSWDIVMGIKQGKITEEQYTQQYVEMMRSSYNLNRDYWEALLQQPKIAIACYCKAGDFCHRNILAKLIAGLCDNKVIPFTSHGELV